jgi:hypothetical protein
MLRAKTNRVVVAEQDEAPSAMGQHRWWYDHVSTDDKASLTRSDRSIETLLELDGSFFEQEGGFWMKIDAKRVDVTEFIPHGIRYNLTLHNQHGTRVLG